jgi:hypothetical protein
MMWDIQGLMEWLMETLPNAEVGEDNDGQIVIYTNLKTISSDGHLVDIEELEAEKPWKIYDENGGLLASFATDTEAYEATYTGEYPDSVEVAYLG